MFEENDGEAFVAAIVGVCKRDNSLASPSQLVSPLVAPPVVLIPTIGVVQYLEVDVTLVVIRT